MSVKTKISQKIAVIGLGAFGHSLATELTRAGIQVLAIDKNINMVDQIADKVDHAVCLDAKDVEALEQNGVHRVDAAAVCMGEDFEDCAVITAHLLEMEVPRVLSRASGEVQAIILRRIGAHDVLFVEQDMGKHWATLLARPGAIEDYEVSESYSIVRIQPEDDWISKSLAELALPKNRGITVLGTYDGSKFKLISDPNMKMQGGHDILVIGHHQDLDRYFAQKAKSRAS
jgi:trk system potassium uptake protein TrkA